MLAAEFFVKLMALYGGLVAGSKLSTWLWAKTHPKFREFRFTTYTGNYWRMNGSRVPLVASKLTDELQNLHSDPDLARERTDWC